MITVIWHMTPYMFSQTLAYIYQTTRRHIQKAVLLVIVCSYIDNLAFGKNCINVRESRNAHKISVRKSRNK